MDYEDKTYDKNNIFAKIIRGEFDSEKVYEDERILAFNDKFPDSPIHVLVVPKDEYISFDDFIAQAPTEDIEYFFKKVRDIAHDLGLGESGYRLVTNYGKDSGQMVPHFHVHIKGGGKLTGK